MQSEKHFPSKHGERCLHENDSSKLKYIIFITIISFQSIITMSSAKSMTCSFCANKKIPGPHGHSIRDFSKKDKPITCPELLAIVCGYCHEKGHTVKYCDVLKKKTLESENRSDCYHVSNSRENKRMTSVDSDGFVHSSKNKQRTNYNDVRIATDKAYNATTLNNSFAALDMETDDEPKSNSSQRNNQIWSHVISGNREVKWGDESEDENDRYFGDD